MFTANIGVDAIIQTGKFGGVEERFAEYFAYFDQARSTDDGMLRHKFSDFPLFYGSLQKCASLNPLLNSNAQLA